MKELIEYIVKSIVSIPEEVVVTVKPSSDFPGLHIVYISVNQADRGKLIGKKGKNISSIRNIAKLASIQMNANYTIVVLEDGENPNNLEVRSSKVEEASAPQLDDIDAELGL